MSDTGDPGNDNGLDGDRNNSPGEYNPDDKDEAQLRDLFNARYPRVQRRRSNRRAVRLAIQHAQGEVWLRDVVSFAAAGVTRWLLALFAVAARSPLGRARADVQGRGD